MPKRTLSCLRGITNVKTFLVLICDIEIDILFIGPESDHCLPLSVTDSLTDSCLVNLIDVTLACEDSNSKLVDVVTVAEEDRVGNNFCRFRSPGKM